MKFVVIILVLILVCGKAKSQNSDSITSELPESLMNLVEDYAENNEENVDLASFIESFGSPENGAININTAQTRELRYILKLSEEQIDNILKYIEAHGPLLTIYELPMIDGFDRATIDQIKDRIIIGRYTTQQKFSFKGMIHHSRSQLFIRYSQVLQQKRGFALNTDTSENINSKLYQGDPSHLWLRYGYNYQNRVRFGITAEKDPGEQFFKGQQKHGFDFYSGFIYLKQIWRIKSLVIGDFQIGYGEGLNLSTGFRMGGSAGMVKPRYSYGIRPSTSANEYRYLRGIAGAFEFGPIELSAFYSYKKMDAKIQYFDSTNLETYYFTSLNQTGLHRTTDEQLIKNSFTNRFYGGSILYKHKIFLAGINVHKNIFNISLLPTARVYNRFDLNGKENTNYGFHFRLLLHHVSFSGEASMSKNGGMAQIFSCYFKPNPIYFFRITFRNYQKNFQNIYSNAFGKFGKNELGIFLGLEARLHKYWLMTISADHYIIPWLKSNISFPSVGSDYWLQLNWQISRQASAYLRYKYTNSEKNATQLAIDKSIDYNIQRIRVHINYIVSPSFSIRNRIEYTSNRLGMGKRKSGFLIYQDLIYRPPVKNYSVIFRYALFDTDGYFERIYAYENDVLYGYSIPAYYYKGYRIYILFSTTLLKNLDLWLKIAHTTYSNINTIGSGLDEISGNQKSEIKVQLRYKF